MSKSASILLFFFAFSLLQILPPVGATGIVDEAHAVMGGKSMTITVKKRFTGEIGEIDQNMKTITMVKKIGEKEFRMVFTFDANTTVNLGTEKKTVADLKTGTKATISYETIDSQNMANNVVMEK